MASLTFPDALARVRSGESPHNVAEALLASLTPDEKLSLLDGDTPFWPGFHDIMTVGYIVHEPYVFGAVPRLEIPGIRFTDGPRGINLGNSTVFPVSMARGATWDVSLEERVGHAIGLEGRAQGANLFGGVCINLPRHPAWGRAQETYSDDPLLLGEFGAALTRGVQRNLMATVKHFALNSMENARFQVDVKIDEAVLQDCFLPHFRRVVEEGALAVMSAYNSVNGEWAGQNEHLLTEVLRSQWGYEWLVMSDFIFGLRDPSKSLKAGLDIEAPFSQQRSDEKRGLKAGLDKGEISIEHVDLASKRILATQLQFFKVRDQEEPQKDIVFSQQHQDLARETASKSIVLLKNEAVKDMPLLPLSPQSVKKLAVVGRLANKANTGDQGSSIVRCSKVVTPYEGLKSAFAQSEVSLSDSGNPDEAAAAAKDADVAIAIVGYTAADEGEYLVPVTADNPPLLDLFPGDDGSQAYQAIGKKMGDMDALWSSTEETGGDRSTVRLRKQDVELINATVAANPRTIVCVTTAGAVITEEFRHNVPGLLFSWYSGTQGGNALADVLTGQVDASGRLPYAIPKTEDDLPFFEKDLKSIEYDQWFGQRLLDNKGAEAAYPLGFGLSYTKFETSQLAIEAAGTEALNISVKVANQGDRAGRQIVQVYGTSEEPGYPKRVLLGFQPVDLEGGAEELVKVKSSLRPLQRWKDGKFVMAGAYRVEVGAFSGDPAALVSDARKA
jgi:beta-glucosidase